jgi:MFS family permease
MDTTIGTTAKPGWQTLLSGRNAIKTLALAGGVTLHAMNVYMATTIMPSIIKDIGGLTYYSWNTTIFIVASIIGSVLSARNLVLQGPKVAYRMATIIFLAGTLIAAMAPAMYILLLGRFVQGLGGGILFALSYAMVRIVFEEALWARAIGLISAMWGIAALTGPFIGGIFAEFNVWRAAFGAIALLTLPLFFLNEKALPGRSGTDAAIPKIPTLKLLLLTLAVLSISFSSVFETLYASLMGVLEAIFFMSVLVWSEKRSANRLLPLGAYKISGRLGAAFLVISLLSGVTTVEIYLPYFLQVIQKFSPLIAGYLTVVMSIGWSLASMFFSGVAAKHVKTILATGAASMLTGMVGLAFLLPDEISNGGIKLVFMSLFLLLIGLGIGMGWPHLLTRVFTSAVQGEEEKTAASITTVQLLAMTFGAALSGVVVNAAGISVPGGLAGAQQAAVWLLGLFAFGPLIALLVIIRQRN